MAPDTTPGDWPSNSRGFLDDAADVTKAAMAASRLDGWFRKILMRLSPWGQVLVGLQPGQTTVFEGPRLARVECQDGRIWVTCPADGRDLSLSGGQSASFMEPGVVVVAAMGGPARVRLGWK